eukprot:symbB.v1.2.035614.t1/scaffold4727.1/size37773/1
MMKRRSLLRQASLLSVSGSMEAKIHLIQQDMVNRYLERHGFGAVNEPRYVPASSRLRMEPLYPIHLASLEGDVLMVRTMLEVGADPDQTFKGLNALDMASGADDNGSHQEVIKILREALKVQTLTF